MELLKATLRVLFNINYRCGVIASVAKLKKEISPVSLLLQMETAANEILTEKTINPLFQRAYNVRGWINARAYEIKHEMALVSAGAFLQVLYVFQTYETILIACCFIFQVSS